MTQQELSKITTKNPGPTQLITPNESTNSTAKMQDKTIGARMQKELTKRMTTSLLLQTKPN
jgi:hypothetical protein